VLSTDDNYPSRWGVDTLCCPRGNTGLITDQRCFVDKNKE